MFIFTVVNCPEGAEWMNEWIQVAVHCQDEHFWTQTMPGVQNIWSLPPHLFFALPRESSGNSCLTMATEAQLSLKETVI